MMGRSHAPSGAAAWLPIGAALGLSTTANLGLAVVAGVAALAPDMDHPHAMLPRVIPGGRFVARRIANATGGHRHGTHALLAVPVVTGFLWYTAYVLTPLGASQALAVALAFGVGYLAHILGDCLTLSGVPLLLPFKNKDYGLRLFRTGGWTETLLVSPVLGFLVVWQAWMLIDPTVTPYVQIARDAFLA